MLSYKQYIFAFGSLDLYLCVRVYEYECVCVTSHVLTAYFDYHCYSLHELWVCVCGCTQFHTDNLIKINTYTNTAVCAVQFRHSKHARTFHAFIFTFDFWCPAYISHTHIRKPPHTITIAKYVLQQMIMAFAGCLSHSLYI